MRFLVIITFLPLLAFVGCRTETQGNGKNSAISEQNQRLQDSKTPRRGYVLKPHEGEVLGTDIIKASPKSGTQGSVMISQTMTGGFSTGLHVHLHADELFYVVSGRGVVTLGDEKFVVETGDVFFAPVGLEHKVAVGEEEQLEVLEFLDKPGLDEEFRVWHTRFADNPAELTLEELNAVARQYGTVYRTLK